MAGLVKVEILVLVVLSDLKMKMGAEASTETLTVDSGNISRYIWVQINNNNKFKKKIILRGNSQNMPSGVQHNV